MTNEQDNPVTLDLFETPLNPAIDAAHNRIMRARRLDIRVGTRATRVVEAFVALHGNSAVPYPGESPELAELRHAVARLVTLSGDLPHVTLIR